MTSLLKTPPKASTVSCDSHKTLLFRITQSTTSILWVLTFYSLPISETLGKAIILSHGTHLSFISDTATIPPYDPHSTSISAAQFSTKWQAKHKTKNNRLTLITKSPTFRLSRISATILMHSASGNIRSYCPAMSKSWKEKRVMHIYA